MAAATFQLSRPARLLVFGSPGVGKGTQSTRLIQRYPQLATISSGDLLRQNVTSRTPLGIMAESKMKAGKMVPDNMMLRLILNELSKRGWVNSGPRVPYTVQATSISDPMDYAVSTNPFSMDQVSLPQEYTYSDSPTASFILDGFPRNAAQAAQVEKLIPLNFVVNIQTPADIIIARICNRWVHAPSGRVYNTTFNAPKVDGRDDITGEQLTRRADDDPEVWKQRIVEFEKASQPLLEHYDRKGLLWTVNGNSSDEISPKLFAEFEKRFCRT
ncbi:adenylate kinase-like protein [Microthyrium microscopicum]|uniref:GTP:AMP phosphotransferase, mitochondrial n=1 Tax=Microthyrium microscopicum TaxID=703497 RepID=A0A6A6UTW1_9PEZI|nr:adenylate kinase-like protein [Microthyrium microscopicum]